MIERKYTAEPSLTNRSAITNGTRMQKQQGPQPNLFDDK